MHPHMAALSSSLVFVPPVSPVPCVGCRFGKATFCGANDLRLNFVTNLVRSIVCSLVLYMGAAMS